MNSKRTSFFKNYTYGLKNAQEPIPGTSKNTDPTLHVVRRLVFKTPKKQKGKEKCNVQTVTPETVDLFDEKDNKEPVLPDIEMYDLTEASEGLYQEEELGDCSSVLQKELEIFKEIERLHEIEEACEQINREHHDLYEINTTEAILAKPVSPNPRPDKLNETIEDATRTKKENTSNSQKILDSSDEQEDYGENIEISEIKIEVLDLSLEILRLIIS